MWLPPLLQQSPTALCGMNNASEHYPTNTQQPVSWWFSWRKGSWRYWQAPVSNRSFRDSCPRTETMANEGTWQYLDQQMTPQSCLTCGISQEDRAVCEDVWGPALLFISWAFSSLQTDAGHQWLTCRLTPHWQLQGIPSAITQSPTLNWSKIYCIQAKARLWKSTDRTLWLLQKAFLPDNRHNLQSVAQIAVQKTCCLQHAALLPTNDLLNQNKNWV